MFVPHPLFTTAPQVPLSQGALAEQCMKKGSKRQDWFLRLRKGIFSKIIELGAAEHWSFWEVTLGWLVGALVEENCSKLWTLPQILTVVHSVSNNSNNG